MQIIKSGCVFNKSKSASQRRAVMIRVFVVLSCLAMTRGCLLIDKTSSAFSSNALHAKSSYETKYELVVVFAAWVDGGMVEVDFSQASGFMSPVVQKRHPARGGNAVNPDLTDEVVMTPGCDLRRVEQPVPVQGQLDRPMAYVNAVEKRIFTIQLGPSPSYPRCAPDHWGKLPSPITVECAITFKIEVEGGCIHDVVHNGGQVRTVRLAYLHNYITIAYHICSSLSLPCCVYAPAHRDRAQSQPPAVPVAYTGYSPRALHS